MAALIGLGPRPRKPVTPAALPAAPERSAAETQELASEQRTKYAKRFSRASTILGSDSDTSIGAIQFLGGAART